MKKIFNESSQEGNIFKIYSLNLQLHKKIDKLIEERKIN